MAYTTRADWRARRRRAPARRAPPPSGRLGRGRFRELDRRRLLGRRGSVRVGALSREASPALAGAARRAHAPPRRGLPLAAMEAEPRRRRLGSSSGAGLYARWAPWRRSAAARASTRKSVYGGMPFRTT